MPSGTWYLHSGSGPCCLVCALLCDMAIPAITLPQLCSNDPALQVAVVLVICRWQLFLLMHALKGLRLLVVPWLCVYPPAL
jgi:hypothetical protein